MPNAQEYRAAARHLRRVAGDLVHGQRLVPLGADVLAGGPLARLMDAAFAAHRHGVERAIAELDRLASVCERRAAICEGYADELRRQRLLVGGWSPWPPRPAPPAWWVET